MKVSGNFLYQIDPKIIAELNQVVSKLSKKDPTLWGEAAAAEAAIRLNWVDLPTSSRELLPQLDALSAWARTQSLTQVILCGMGGSSLAPEVIANTYKRNLTILDSTDPKQIINATPKDLGSALVIIASKSGSTIETTSQMAYFEEKFISAKLDPANHFVIVTDPNSALETQARSKGYKVINADPNVGGRFSALSAYGLVPAALVGFDVTQLLDDAVNATKNLVGKDCVAAIIAAAIYQSPSQFITFINSGSALPGLEDWIEQLIAESTGKDGKGKLPILNKTDAQLKFGMSIGFASGDYDLVVEAELGAHFILWEWVTALLSYLLKVDPFNQPNVTEAKEQTNHVINKGNFAYPQELKTFEDEIFQIYSNKGVSSLDDFLQLKNEYFAVMAYLTRDDDDLIAKLSELISAKTGVASTFGWAPRFLHSTGQFHKGGTPNGAFIQVTSQDQIDLAIPGKTFTFKELITAQAIGDAVALRNRSYPFLQIHLKDKKIGILKLIEGLKQIN
jgi:glucose-6-phosphate isomerase